MTPHQENRLRLLTERGTVAFTRDENLRKLAVECLELALVIEHHLEGKRGLEDIALELADATVMLDRETKLSTAQTQSVMDIEDLEDALYQVIRCSLLARLVANGELSQTSLPQCLLRTEEAFTWLRRFVGAKYWHSALDVKLSKAERYITDRELGRQPQSLLARPAGGLE